MRCQSGGVGLGEAISGLQICVGLLLCNALGLARHLSTLRLSCVGPQLALTQASLCQGDWDC